MAIEVHSKSELKAAIKKGADEIIVLDTFLTKQLKGVKYIKGLSPVAVGVAIAAIPLIVGTGGIVTASSICVAPEATWVTSTTITLIVAVGGAIAISLFTDWEYVDLPGGIKLRRKGAK